MPSKPASRHLGFVLFGVSACFAIAAPALAADGCGRFHRFSYRLERCVLRRDVGPRLVPVAPRYRPGSVRLAPTSPPGILNGPPGYRRYRLPARPLIRVHSPLMRISL